MNISDWVDHQIQVLYLDGGSIVGKLARYAQEEGYLVLQELGGHEEVVIFIHAVKAIRLRAGDSGPMVIRARPQGS